MTTVKEFLDSLARPVPELPDVERADIAAEDSSADATAWTRIERNDSEEADQVEFLKRRLIPAQDLADGRYSGRKVSSKAIFSGDDMRDLARFKRNDNSDSDQTTEKSESSEDGDTDSDRVVDNLDQKSVSTNDDGDCDDDDDNDDGGDDDNDSDGKDDNDDDHDLDIEGEEKMKQSDIEGISPEQEIDDADKDLVKISNDMQHHKAESVRKQLMIWDRLMHLQVLSHAALRTFNQLPREQFAKQLRQSANSETRKNCAIMQKNLRLLIGIFGALENSLVKSSKQTKHLLDRDNSKGIEDSDDEEIESSADEEGDEKSNIMDMDEEEQNLDIPSASERNEIMKQKRIVGRKRKNMAPITAEDCAKRHERFAQFRSSTLSKWDERTTLIGIGTTKNKKNDFSGFESLVLKQIDQIMSEKHRLLRRTQMKRNDIDRMGSIEDSNYDAEIFDDDDFYQQLLKEVIERKTVGIVDPIEMSRQWLEIQNLRQKRSKRKKVDTKASKGRKIRYVVIPELVNYFPSMPESVKWTPEARNQLFKSLFTP